MACLKFNNLFSRVSSSASSAARQPFTFHLSPFTFHNPRSGFTLIELLIVTVVIVTLMGIVFRLAGAGGDSRAKSKTQARLQRLENAISGYYAAYGSYPPVPLQGRSRDINVQVNEHTGVQGNPGKDVQNVNLSNVDEDSKEGQRILRQVEAACRAQPIAVLYPFFMNDQVNSELRGKKEKLVTALAMEKNNAPFSFLKNVGGLNLGTDKEAELFQFGLLSFLLPRYLFMLGGDPAMYDTRHCQWEKNNQLPCRIDTGRPYESWAGQKSIQEYLHGRGSSAEEASLVSNLTSQAVCARWMPNFRDERDGIVSGGYDFYGVDTSDGDWPYLGADQYDALPVTDKGVSKGKNPRKWLHYVSPRGYDGGQSSVYLLDGMTVADGWGREFYYYSDTPYQSYKLWSAGKNGLTFPPWLMEHLNSYSSKEQETIATWTHDDISHLAN